MADLPTPDYSAPHDVSDLVLAFPASVVGTLLPEDRLIPREFHDSRNAFHRLASGIIHGNPPEGDWETKPGIDGERMSRHIAACARSFEPKHEHKIAGIAYLLSLWLKGSTPIGDIPQAFADGANEGRPEGELILPPSYVSGAERRRQARAQLEEERITPDDDVIDAEIIEED